MMAEIQGEEIYLSHSGQEIDGAVDDVASLSTAIAGKADQADLAALQTIVDAKPSVESVTVTPANVAFTEFQYSAIAIGDVLTVNIRAVPTNAIAISSSFLLASIASGYRPPYIIAASCFSNNVLRQCWINSEGGVRLRVDEAIPAGATIVISCSFNHNDDGWRTV
jgi:hypothetical protein